MNKRMRGEEKNSKYSYLLSWLPGDKNKGTSYILCLLAESATDVCYVTPARTDWITDSAPLW